MNDKYGPGFWERAAKATDEYAALTGEVLALVRDAEGEDAALAGTREAMVALLDALAVLRTAYSTLGGIVPQKGADGRLARPGYNRYGAPPRGGARPQ